MVVHDVQLWVKICILWQDHPRDRLLVSKMELKHSLQIVGWDSWRRRVELIAIWLLEIGNPWSEMRAHTWTDHSFAVLAYNLPILIILLEKVHAVSSFTSILRVAHTLTDDLTRSSPQSI